MKSITLVFKSSRDPGKHHRVHLLATDPVAIKCTCPAGRRGGQCKHVRLLKMMVDHGQWSEIETRWKNQPGW